MSANSNLLDKFLDENNNWFNHIDTQSASMQFSLPEPTFSFKSGHKRRSDAADEAVTCKLTNNLTTSPPQQQQQPQQLTKQSVKRALFVEKDEINHEANLKLVQAQLEQLLEEDCKKWNFDFKNNRPLHNANSQYEWQLVGESVLGKLDLNRSAVDAMDEAPIKSSRPTVSKPAAQSAVRGHSAASSSICNKAAGKLSNSNSTNSPIATRSSSLKRKLMNIDDYFLPTKKRNACLVKEVKALTDNLLPANRTVKTAKRPNELAGDSRSLRLQAPSIKSSLKCKKTSKQAACRSPRTRQKKSKSLEKANKRQTTLKF